MANDKFYGSAAWFRLRAKVRRLWLAQDKPCAWCGQPFRPVDKVFVDHVINRKQRPDLALDESNLECVHEPCNTRKYHHQEVNNKKPIGINGLPDDWN